MTFSLFIFTFVFTTVLGCSITATRPTQEMSDTAASIRAAKEVQADTLAPDLYRRSNEWFFKAKHEYKFKNFKLAKEFAEKARYLAEQAEFEALRNGGNRTEQAFSDPLSNTPAATGPVATATPYSYPTPTGTPADAYEQRKAEDEARNQPKTAPSPVFVPVPVPVPQNFR